MENKYTWIDFYTKFANSLLKYKQNRGELVQKLTSIFNSVGMNVPKLSNGEWTDIDPFTVYALFNRGITGQNRVTFIKELIQKFDVAAECPLDFEGIPVVQNLNCAFYRYEDNPEAQINDLWEMFEKGIVYADNKTDEAKSSFLACYNKIKDNKGLKFKLSIGLYWIRPNYYMGLDDRNKQLIKNLEIFKDAAPFLYKTSGVPTAEEYIQLRDALLAAFGNKVKYHNFPELSSDAYHVFNKEQKEKKNNETSLKEEDTSGKHYWWLNANPKIWSFNDIEVDSEQSYTLYNDNGNKRRVFQNFIDAKEGDFVIGYESNPVKQVVALAVVSRANDGKNLYFKKIEQFENPIDYQDLKQIDDLKNMEYFISPQGSLFKLTKAEFDCIMGEVREGNPVKQVKQENKPYTEDDFLRDVYTTKEKYDELVAILRHKKNIILKGAPGVGKTYTAKRLAYSIMGKKDENRIACVQFHQNYSYEDFVMGYKPQEDGYKLENGIFYQFCVKAQNDPENDYFFIIDEINRGNMSKILGELLMLIEKDYRGSEHKITLAYNKKSFYVPENVYIIGMMNTADRSLALIDYALRRRFSFFHVNPAFDSEGFKSYQKSLKSELFDDAIREITRLNQEIENDSSLGNGFCIGHSYFCGQKEYSKDWLKEIIYYEIIPLIEEYWFDDTGKVESWTNELKSLFNDK